MGRRRSKLGRKRSSMRRSKLGRKRSSRRRSKLGRSRSRSRLSLGKSRIYWSKSDPRMIMAQSQLGYLLLLEHLLLE